MYNIGQIAVWKVWRKDNKCLFFHKFTLVKNTGITRYYKCKKCSYRKIEQDTWQGYQPIDSKFLSDGLK